MVPPTSPWSRTITVSTRNIYFHNSSSQGHQDPLRSPKHRSLPHRSETRGRQRQQGQQCQPRRRSHLDAAHPVAHRREGALGRNVVHHQNAIRLPEILLGDAAEPEPDRTTGTLRTTGNTPQKQEEIIWLSAQAPCTCDASPGAGACGLVTNRSGLWAFGTPPVQRARQPRVSRSLSQHAVLRKQEGRPFQIRKRNAEKSV